MFELKVKLPDWAGEYIEEQIAAGQFDSADELLTELIDQARAIVVDDRMAELIREGMESGEPVEVTDQWWSRVREKVRAEVQRRRTA